MFLAEQLAAVSLVVLDLDGVQFMGSAGRRCCSKPTNARPEEVDICVWYANLGWLIGLWTRRNYESCSRSPTRWRQP